MTTKKRIWIDISVAKIQYLSIFNYNSRCYLMEFIFKEFLYTESFESRHY